jgi:hypothetical protein
LHGVLRTVAFLFWIYVKKIIFLCFRVMRCLYLWFSSSTHVIEYAKHISIPFHIWRVKHFGQNNMQLVMMVHCLCIHKTHVFICISAPLCHWPVCDHLQGSKKYSFSNQISKRHNFWKMSIYERIVFFRNFDKFKKSNQISKRHNFLKKSIIKESFFL